MARARSNRAWTGAGLGALVAVCYLTLKGGTNWLDYPLEAKPAFTALIHGHLHLFLHRAPGYAGSLVLRAPFVLVAHAFGAEGAWIFRASAIPCLAAGVALALWLVSMLDQRGAGFQAKLLVLLVCAINPLTIQAVAHGHPEELLGAVLCVAAILTALSDRPILSGILLGVAIANKEWAVLATGPVLLALPRRRLLALGWAAVATGLLLGPFFLGANGGTAIRTGSTTTGWILQRWQAWWFFGIPRRVPSELGPNGSVLWSARNAPGWISTYTHPLIVAVGALLSALHAWIRRRRGQPTSGLDCLLLFALLMLVRCVLDPWDIVYYVLPVVLALAAWEVLRHGRTPVVAMAASTMAWVLMYETARPLFAIPQDVQSVLFLCAAVPAVVVLALRLWAPGRLARRIRRAPSAEALPVTG